MNILHTVILDGLLGIGPDRLDREQSVSYVRHAEEAIGLLADPKYQVAFLVNPVKLGQIKAIVSNGERFPQKTTDFYPKLLTGLLFCTLEFQEG